MTNISANCKYFTNREKTIKNQERYRTSLSFVGNINQRGPSPDFQWDPTGVLFRLSGCFTTLSLSLFGLKPNEGGESLWKVEGLTLSNYDIPTNKFNVIPIQGNLLKKWFLCSSYLGASQSERKHVSFASWFLSTCICHDWSTSSSWAKTGTQRRTASSSFLIRSFGNWFAESFYLLTKCSCKDIIHLRSMFIHDPKCAISIPSTSCSAKRSLTRKASISWSSRAFSAFHFNRLPTNTFCIHTLLTSENATVATCNCTKKSSQYPHTLPQSTMPLALWLRLLFLRGDASAWGSKLPTLHTHAHTS